MPPCSTSSFSSLDSPAKPSLLPASMSVDSPPDVNSDPLQMARYRPAAQVPEHIREHCHIYLDEQLYISALTLLSDLVTSGASDPQRENRPVFAPPPLHIELISCLLVHPRYTSQAPPNERTELASRSITFLRNALAILGPVNANLDEAFSLSFAEGRAGRRARLMIDTEDGTSGSESDDRSGHMKGIIANKGRLRRCAKDFWHIVGWVFNCSVKHSKRWKYWKVWLGYMLDVLDADWKERDSLDREDPNWQIKQEADPDVVCQSTSLRKCLLLQYLRDVPGHSTALKRVVRSVFADASPDSLKEFPEVFVNETKDVRHSGQKRKRGKRFGDYDDEDDEAPYDSSEFTDLPLDAAENNDESISGPDQDAWLGGSESLTMRQTLITLLSRAAHYLPDEFVPVVDLYDAIYTSAKALPLPAFSLFTTPSYHSHLRLEVYISLSQLLLLRLLPNNAPRPHLVNRQKNDDLSQIMLEKCLLPFAANTSSVQDNAKVSILVENMLRLFLKSCDWEYTKRFVEAIEKGVVARETKAKGDKRRKDVGVKGKGEEGDMAWLKASGERLRILKRFIEQTQKSCQ